MLSVYESFVRWMTTPSFEGLTNGQLLVTGILIVFLLWVSFGLAMGHPMPDDEEHSQ